MTNTEAITMLEQMDATTISPRQLSEIIGGNPYSYNCAARDGRLDLPHIWRGRNLRIFVAPLLRMLKGE